MQRHDPQPHHTSADRRGPLLLVVPTMIGSLGLAAGGTAGALVAVEVTGHDAVAGLPLGLLVVGSAASAVLIAEVGRRRGRPVGLAVGYTLGVLGASLVVVATRASSFPVVLLGSLLLGAANAAVFMTRYAAAELAPPHRRARALATTLSATAGGAVAGVFLLGPAGHAARSLGLADPVGLYLLAIPTFGLAALLLVGLHRRRIRPSAPARVAAGGPGLAAATVTALRRPGARSALLVLAIGNAAMTAVMVVVPVHLMGHDHRLDAVGMLIAVHVVGMFAPSPLTGRAADRVGGRSVGMTGLATLLITSAVWSQVPDATGWAAGALLLALGVGWNVAVVGGSAILASGTSDDSRLHAEAAGEVVMALAAAIGAPLAGVLVATAGFRGLCLAVATTGGLALLAASRRRWTAPGAAGKVSDLAGPGQIPASAPDRTGVPDVPTP